MSKPTVTSVKAELDTHEAVCAERWKETILRIKRIEHIMIGTAGTTILLLVGIILNGMIHVFLLFVYVGVGEDKRLTSNDMYFRSVDDCVYFAQRLHKQGNNITAYCLPKLVDKDVRTY